MTSTPYDSYGFYRHFTAALTRKGDYLVRKDDGALRRAFGKVLNGAREYGLINGDVYYEYFIPYLVDTEKVTLPQERHDDHMRIKQCAASDEHKTEFDALAAMFTEDTSGQNVPPIPAPQGRKSSRKTRRSASSPSVQSGIPSQ
jgi:hypothetical protein